MLIHEETIFILDVNDQDEFFKTVSDKLLEKELIADGFYQAIVEREKEYPTGIDLKPLGVESFNIAIPHTEAEYNRDTRIVVSVLKNPIQFGNMINPMDHFDVSVTFMILNADAQAQSTILAQIMDYLANNTEDLKQIQQSTDPTEIFNLLKDKFN